MKNKLSFEQFSLSDRKEIQQLFVDTIRAICQTDYSAEQIKIWTDSVKNIERWDEILLTQDVIVAKIEDKIVAFGTLKDKNYIDLFYVHKAFQGLKIASKLFYEIEKEAVRSEQSYLTADVSTTAKPFFEKMGFLILRQQTVVRQNVEFTNYKMKKLLLEKNAKH